MDWNLLKEPKTEFDWSLIKPPEEEKEFDWTTIEPPAEAEDITTPASAPGGGGGVGAFTPEQDKYGVLGIGAKAVGGETLPEPTKIIEDFNWVESQTYNPERTDALLAGTGILAQSIAKIPQQVKAAVLQATQGSSGASVVNKDKADKYIAQAQVEQQKFVQEAVKKYGDINVLPGIKISDVASMPQSMAFSATSMGAGLATGVPIALLPVPGSRVAAYLAGTTASGVAAYKISTYQIMQSYLDVKNGEKLTTTGQGLTQEEEDSLKKGFNNLATQYGLWEAVPEALSNLAFVSILTAPLTKMIGKNIAGKVLNKVAGIYGEELLTETITQMGQANIEVKGGISEQPLREWTSPEDWVQSFKEVAPQTFLLTTVMGGAGTLVINTSKVVKSLKNEVKDGKVKEELIKKVENKETLQEAVLKTPKELKQEVEQEQFKKEISKGAYKEKPVSVTKEGATTEEKAEVGELKEPWQMTREEYGKKRKVSKQKEFTGAANLILREPNTDTTMFLYGKEKLIGENLNFHTYITPKGEFKGKKNKFIVNKWQKDDGTIRYTVHGLNDKGNPYKTVSSAVQFKIENNKPTIMTIASSDKRLGLADKLLNEVKKDYGDYISTGSISQSGLRLLHKNNISKALAEGKPVPTEVLADYPDLKTTPTAPVSKKEIVEPTPPLPTTGKGKVSKIAGSIETKSIEAGLTKGFGHLAEYTPIVIKEQAEKASNLINTDINEVRRIIRGDKPLPGGLKGTALITAMEEHIKKTADGTLASELANSPLVSGTSAAAQELRLAAERDPESPVKAIQDINKILGETVKKRYPGKILNKVKDATIGKIKDTISKANTKYSWEAFIRSIEC